MMVSKLRKYAIKKSAKDIRSETLAPSNLELIEALNEKYDVLDTKI